MPGPTQSDVHVNRPLTNILIAYLQDRGGFVADRVFPTVGVSKQSDRYFTIDRGEFNRNEAQIRAAGTESAGGTYTVDSTPTYYCDVVAFHHDIPDQVRANADSPLDLDRQATEFVGMKLLIQKEVSWASSYFTTSKWGTDITGVAASPTGSQVLQWNDASSTPIEDIRAGKRAVHSSTGFMPNKLTLSGEVWDKLVDHPDIVDRIKYGQTPGSPAMVTKAAVAALLELDEILVMEGIQNTAKKGATASHSYIAGKAALLTYSPPNPGLMIPSAGYTFAWTGFTGAGGNGERVKRLPVPLIESERVEGQIAYDHKLVASDLGYFFTSVIA